MYLHASRRRLVLATHGVDFDPSDYGAGQGIAQVHKALSTATSSRGVDQVRDARSLLDAVGGRVQGGVDGVAHGNEPGYNVRGAVDEHAQRCMVALRASAFTRRDAGYIDDPRRRARTTSSGAALSCWGADESLLLWRPSDDSLKLGALPGQPSAEVLKVDAAGLGDLLAESRAGLQMDIARASRVLANLTAQIGAELATS